MEWVERVGALVVGFLTAWAVFKKQKSESKQQEVTAASLQAKTPIEVADLINEVSRKAVQLAKETYEEGARILESRLDHAERRIAVLEAFIIKMGHDPKSIT